MIKDFTKGDIFKQILSIAIPIIATSFIQMAYNMTDMAWLGRVGSDTVGAVGIALYFTWLGTSLMFITKIGAEVGISQALGNKNKEKAIMFAQNSVVISLIISSIFALGIFIFTDFLVSLFNVKSLFVNSTAVNYLKIIAVGIPFAFTNICFSGLYNAIGDTKTPFWINSLGLGLNLILDPLLIFGYGPIPAMGAQGAAIATVGAQLLVFTIFFVLLKSKRNPLGTDSYFTKLHREYIAPIFKIGGPVALQSACFAFFAMVLARVLNNIAQGSEIPMSVQSIGSQIEALSWMTASGFATALGTFTGQNYGAQKWDRIRKGFFVTLAIASSIGVISTCLFFFWGEKVFGLFLKTEEYDVIKLGIVYLKILSISQIFMCVEIATSGAFNGIGKAGIPAVIGIIGNFLRIPMAFLFSYTLVDLLPSFSSLIPESYINITGVWWGISFSSVFKGSVLFIWFVILINGKNNSNNKKPLYIRLIPSRLRQQAQLKKTRYES